MSENVIVGITCFSKVDRQNSVDLGPYSIIIEKKSLDESRTQETIGYVYTKKIDNHNVMFYSPYESNKEFVVGIKGVDYPRRDLSKILRRKAKKFGKCNTREAIINKFIKHAESLDW